MTSRPAASDRFFRSLVVGITLATAIGLAGESPGTAPAPQLAALQDPRISAVEQAECLAAGEARTARHPRTGALRFVGTEPGRPIPHPRPLRAIGSPEEAARAYLGVCGSLFGLQELPIQPGTQDQASHLRVSASRQVDGRRSVIRFQQVHQSVPILGGELIVNLDSANNILAVAGKSLPQIGIDTTPAVDAAAAAQTALGIVAKTYGVDPAALTTTTPKLWIYDPTLIGPGGGFASLVWRMDVTPRAVLPIRELVLVHAQRGSVALHFNQVESARNRKTYTVNNAYTLISLPGTLVCDESNPTCTGGDSHAAAAHLHAGDTYDFYMNYLGRDSIDNAGMTMTSSVHFDVDYQNVFWDGNRKQMVYGDGYGFPLADDVVAHELTHGVTQHESNLFYYYQSGAINESLSDVFGEFVDQVNGRGTDDSSVKWLMGEDVTGLGAIRSMKDPPAVGDPDKLTSGLYSRTNGFDDNGGVHTNSGVNNKAAYLMTDGGTFNGQTVTGLGIPKVAKIYYEVQTNLLTSAADYADLSDALYQGCNNLVGTGGVTSADCQEVRKATTAVEMTLQPVGGPFNMEAALCAPGQTPANVFFDNLESGAGNFVFSASKGSVRWRYDSPYGPYAYSGQHFLYANDVPARVADTTAAMASSVALPFNAFLHFAHAFGFDGNYDGGVVEYSVNGGSTWTDAGSLFEANGYTGTLYTATDNPLGGRPAFVVDSHGYISSRLNLSSLGGQSIRFRWRMALDLSDPAWGWWLDDVRIYTCAGTAAGGSVTGYVRNATTNAPISGAQVSTGIGTYATTTDATGLYTLVLPVGTITLAASASGFTTASATGVNVTSGGTTAKDFSLAPAIGAVTGHVRHATTNGPIAGAQVRTDTGTYSTTTDATGLYTLALPEGTHTLTASASTYLPTTVSQVGVTSGDTRTRDFALAPIPLVVFVVNSTLDAVDAVPGNGLCATAGGVCTLRAAIMESNAQTGTVYYTITLSAATYTLTIVSAGGDPASTGDLNVKKEITINGTGAVATIIDANGIDRAFSSLSGGSLTLNDLTVQKGKSFSGGCISFSHGPLTLNRVIVKACNATLSPGGGIDAWGSTSLSLIDATIIQNVTTSSGGGLVISGTGTATITRTTISGNSASSGGGIYSYSAVTLANTTISNNTANYGGAIAYSSFSGNAMALDNVTITGNFGSNQIDLSRGSGGLDNFFKARNTIIANPAGGPSATNCRAQGGVITDLQNNIEFPGTTCGFSDPSDRRADPLLGPLAHNGGPTQTHALGANSPAIDVGDAAACSAAPVSRVDQRTFVRPAGACDMGAYEFGAVVGTVAMTGIKTVAGSFVPTGTVTYTVGLSNTGNSTQADNAGSEFTDVLPPELTLVSATATSGTAIATVGTNTVTWNGSLVSGGAVTITIQATVKSTSGRLVVSNQGTVSFDADVNGTNESAGVTDNPATPGANDATVFTVGVLRPTVTITSPPATSTSPFVTLGGTAVVASDVAGDGPRAGAITTVTWASSRGPSGTATGTTSWQTEVPLFAGANVIAVTVTDSGGITGTAVVTINVTSFVYYLAEGATGPFFDLELLIANPNIVAAPVTIQYLKEDGTTVAQALTVPGQRHATILVDSLAGLEATAVSCVITSTAALPLAVERTMRWDATGYGTHTEKATSGARLQWFFAEGSQGFFDTYLLLANPQATASSATVVFLVEGGSPVTKTYQLTATSRTNVFAGLIPELVGKSFGMTVTFTQPGVAERAMYFGSTPGRVWSGGHESAGVNEASASWFLAEGATGTFFDTFVLLSNPNAVDVVATLTFLLDSGATIVGNVTVPANGRTTVNVEAVPGMPMGVGVATQVVATAPILAERAMYWPGGFSTWYEAHNAFGVTSTGTRWALGEGRVGGPANLETYILLANPGAVAATVTVTYLREGAAPIVKNYTVPATSRLNVVPASDGLSNESFGALITSTQPIAVERAMYATIGGVFWAAGTNATATKIP